MRLIGNILWIVLGGLLSSLGWILAGVIWCVTVVGIPVGLQCFKLSSISLNPFGKEVVDEGGSVSFILNVLWFLVSGVWMAIGNFILGCILCITVIGIPFGRQFFKIAALSLAPFGKKVVRSRYL